MKKIKNWFLLFGGCILIFLSTVSFGSSPNYKYKLAVCSMFKNEAPYLKEWIEFHRLIGVSHFYLYNNDSTDNYMEILKPYIDQNIVELTEWESIPEHGMWGIWDVVFVPYQFGAFNDCIKNKALGVAEWVAVIDTDEFIFPLNGKDSLLVLLDRFEPKVGSLLFFWKCFGTSSVWELKEGELVTEKLYQRAEDSHEWNWKPKSIHRPEAIEFCNIHDTHKYKEGFYCQYINSAFIRINHYWSRTQSECMKKRQMTYDQVLEFEKRLNQVDDTSMYQYLPELKKAILEN